MQILKSDFVYFKNYTSAYFIDNNDLIIIDIGDTAYQTLLYDNAFLKLNKFDLKNFKDFYIFITNTRFDHINGIPQFIQYVFYVLGKVPIIVVQSSEVEETLNTLLKIGNIPKNMYNLLIANTLNKDFLINTIYIEDKCCGYVFRDNNIHTIYIGNTWTLEPFKPHIHSYSSVYIDMFNNYTKKHLTIDKILNELDTKLFFGTKLYLMNSDANRQYFMNVISQYSKHIYLV